MLKEYTMDNMKFLKYFKEALESDPAANAPIDDAAAFAGSFENDESAAQLQGEVDNASIAPEQRAELLQKADKYANLISDKILPILRKLQDDIVSGTFATIAPDIKNISKINEDLASLSESLRGRVRDAVIKSDSNTEK